MNQHRGGLKLQARIAVYDLLASMVELGFE
jgi:hypothetical protein